MYTYPDWIDQATVVEEPEWTSNYQRLDNQSIVMQAREGINSDLFWEVNKYTGIKHDYLSKYLQVSLKTIQRYGAEQKSFDPVKSEQLLKIAALFKKGDELFGSRAGFARWLSKPAVAFGQEQPIAFVATPGGIDLLLDELARIEYGDLA